MLTVCSDSLEKNWSDNISDMVETVRHMEIFFCLGWLKGPFLHFFSFFRTRQTYFLLRNRLSHNLSYDWDQYNLSSIIFTIFFFFFLLANLNTLICSGCDFISWSGFFTDHLGYCHNEHHGIFEKFGSVCIVLLPKPWWYIYVKLQPLYAKSEEIEAWKSNPLDDQ